VTANTATDRATPDSSPPSRPAARPGSWRSLPEIDLRQLLRLTDDTGMFQHAMFATPDPNHGYCIDDNARALVAALLHARLRGYDERVVPLTRYLMFLAYAYNEDTGRFRNFMGYDRRWLENQGSQDSQGRNIWALGQAVAEAPTEHVRELAQNLFHKAVSSAEGFDWPRSKAFALLGLDYYLRFAPDEPHPRGLRQRLASELHDAFRAHASDDWPWWEDQVTYDNAKLPHALMLSGAALGDDEMVRDGLRALRWLMEVQTGETPDGRDCLSIIGCKGWLRRGQPMAKFDQQPLEAYAMVHACLLAAKLDDPEHTAEWAEMAWTCFEWFRGRNIIGVPLYHEETGGCQDGLLPDGANKNQGAESVLAYLLSVLELTWYREHLVNRIHVRPPQTVGVGIVGLGSFAQFSVEAYRGLERVRPVAVWDRAAQKADAYAAAEGMRAFEGLDQMLADPAVQLVHVATIPAEHAGHVAAAISRGKHVLCEKPLATTPADAQQMIATAAQQDRVLGIDFMMRHGPLFDPIRRLIASRALGDVLRGSVMNLASDSGYPAGHWFWDEELSGGLMVEHGVHHLDLLRGWLGEGKVLSASRFRRPVDDDDNAAAHESVAGVIDQASCELRYGPQTSGSFYHAFVQSHHLDRQWVQLLFEQGELTISGWIGVELEGTVVGTEAEVARVAELLPGQAEVDVVRRYRGDQRIARRRQRTAEVDVEARIRWSAEGDKPDVYAAAIRALVADLVEAIIDRRHELKVTAADGLVALELAAEATRQARALTP